MSSTQARTLDVLIPTFERPSALAVTLAGLNSQSLESFRVMVSDQSESSAATEKPEVQAVIRALETSGRPVRTYRHTPRRGLAEHRAFLLGQSNASYVLFLDDDLLLDPGVLARMLAAIREERCGFVGCAPIGLSYVHDKRPAEQHIEPWSGPVLPESVDPSSPAWQRHALHNAANVWHVQQQDDVWSHLRMAEGIPYLPYRIAWVGGCVLYDAEKLRASGGFEFWRELPEEHAGEDVVAQLRVMSLFGGCGILPSGVTHLELPTTVHNREADAPQLLSTVVERD